MLEQAAAADAPIEKYPCLAKELFHAFPCARSRGFPPMQMPTFFASDLIRICVSRDARLLSIEHGACVHSAVPDRQATAPVQRAFSSQWDEGQRNGGWPIEMRQLLLRKTVSKGAENGYFFVPSKTYSVRSVAQSYCSNRGLCRSKASQTR